VGGLQAHFLTLVRVQTTLVNHTKIFKDLRSSDKEFLNDDPPLVSVEPFKVSGEGHATASTTPDSENVALVSSSSSSQTLGLHAATDVPCLELWHPNAINGMHQLLSIIPRQNDKPALPHSSPSH
jgi:hypothetical protein